MLLALHLISTEKCNATSCSIAVDNQAALKAFDSNMRSPGHHLAHEFLLLVNRMLKRSNKRKYGLTLRWMAGHCGIPGNEKVDREAKLAASGITSDTKTLPLYLRKPLLTNPAAAKRMLNDNLLNKWKTEWPQTTRGKKMKKIDKSTPSTKFLKTISKDKLSREAASRIAQLRIGHIPLNSYLYKFKRADKTNCPACGEDYEMPLHFLLSCPIYAFERWALERQVKKKKKNPIPGDTVGRSGLGPTASKLYRWYQLI